MTNLSGDFIEWNKLKSLDHMPGAGQYLIAGDLRYYESKLGSCGFCQWFYKHTVMAASDPDSDLRPASEFTIWVIECGKNSTITGLPEGFTVYMKYNPTNGGGKAHWKACWDHAYLAYLDYQQIMLDELHDWDLTDRWMQNRNGRI